MEYKFAKLIDGKLRTLSFSSEEEVEKWISEELETFKQVNHVQDEEKDKSFLDYKENLERRLRMQMKVNKAEGESCRERLNPEDIKPFDGILNPAWVVNMFNVCDSPTTENK